MSQSDYINYKKISYKLNSLSHILNSQDYINFKQYELQNTIYNTKNTNTQLQQPNSTLIFGIETKNGKNCPNFILCNNTNLRSNRKLNSSSIYCNSLLNSSYKSFNKNLKIPINKSEYCNNCFSVATSNKYSHKLM
jgi:hypothetical protein